MTLEIHGMEDIARNLKKMTQKLTHGAGNVVEAGAKVQYKAVRNSLSVDTGKAKETLEISKPYKRRGATYVAIGWSEDSQVGFRYHFVEWGTVHIAPQLKITKAVKSTNSAKLSAMMRQLKKEMK